MQIEQSDFRTDQRRYRARCVAAGLRDETLSARLLAAPDESEEERKWGASKRAAKNRRGNWGPETLLQPKIQAARLAASQLKWKMKELARLLAKFDCTLEEME